MHHVRPVRLRHDDDTPQKIDPALLLDGEGATTQLTAQSPPEETKPRRFASANTRRRNMNIPLDVHEVMCREAIRHEESVSIANLRRAFLYQYFYVSEAAATAAEVARMKLEHEAHVEARRVHLPVVDANWEQAGEVALSGTRWSAAAPNAPVDEIVPCAPLSPLQRPPTASSEPRCTTAAVETQTDNDHENLRDKKRLVDTSIATTDDDVMFTLDAHAAIPALPLHEIIAPPTPLPVSSSSPQPQPPSKRRRSSSSNSIANGMTPNGDETTSDRHLPCSTPKQQSAPREENGELTTAAVSSTESPRPATTDTPPIRSSPSVGDAAAAVAIVAAETSHVNQQQQQQAQALFFDASIGTKGRALAVTRPWPHQSAQPTQTAIAAVSDEDESDEIRNNEESGPLVDESPSAEGPDSDVMSLRREIEKLKLELKASSDDQERAEAVATVKNVTSPDHTNLVIPTNSSGATPVLLAITPSEALAEEEALLTMRLDTLERRHAEREAAVEQRHAFETKLKEIAFQRPNSAERREELFQRSQALLASFELVGRRELWSDEDTAFETLMHHYEIEKRLLTTLGVTSPELVKRALSSCELLLAGERDAGVAEDGEADEAFMLRQLDFCCNVLRLEKDEDTQRSILMLREQAAFSHHIEAPSIAARAADHQLRREARAEAVKARVQRLHHRNANNASAVSPSAATPRAALDDEEAAAPSGGSRGAETETDRYGPSSNVDRLGSASVSQYRIASQDLNWYRKVLELERQEIVARGKLEEACGMSAQTMERQHWEGVKEDRPRFHWAYGLFTTTRPRWSAGVRAAFAPPSAGGGSSRKPVTSSSRMMAPPLPMIPSAGRCSTTDPTRRRVEDDFDGDEDDGMPQPLDLRPETPGHGLASFLPALQAAKSPAPPASSTPHYEPFPGSSLQRGASSRQTLALHVPTKAYTARTISSNRPTALSSASPAPSSRLTALSSSSMAFFSDPAADALLKMLQLEISCRESLSERWRRLFPQPPAVLPASMQQSWQSIVSNRSAAAAHLENLVHRQQPHHAVTSESRASAFSPATPLPQRPSQRGTQSPVSILGSSSVLRNALFPQSSFLTPSPPPPAAPSAAASHRYSSMMGGGSLPHGAAMSPQPPSTIMRTPLPLQRPLAVPMNQQLSSQMPLFHTPPVRFTAS